MNMVKRCKKCGEFKPLDDFYRASTAADGHRSECKACAKAIRHAYYVAHREEQIARVRAWREANPTQYRETQARIRKRRVSQQRADHLKRAFGLTVAAYEAILAAQGEACAICKRIQGTGSLHVDHDHATGEIRGLLCFRCNNALGLLGDDADVLQSAIEYLDTDLEGRLTSPDLASRARARLSGLQDVSG
jgi:hypothetical protein